MTRLGRWLVLLCLLFSGAVFGKPLTVAVASNFKFAAADLFAHYEQMTGQQVRLISGSTGKLYAQILHGAPYDLFLSADIERPVQLEQAKLIIDNSRKTYAIGRLALWHPSADKNVSLALLNQPQIKRIALANPKVAPYGSAAKHLLEQSHMWGTIKSKLVMGENVSQTFQFTQSGNAQAAFVPLSLLRQVGIADEEIFIIPESNYPPIEQQMVLLSNSAAAKSLWQFLLSSETGERLILLGYKRP